jgi:putative ABC transport system permease protein
MLRATLRSLLARKLRLLLSALAVVVGVSFVAGTLVLTDTLNATFNSSFAATTKNVAADVRGADQSDSAGGAGLVPASLVPALDRVPGVLRAVGQVEGGASLVSPTGKFIASGTAPEGVNWTGDQPTSVVTIADGRAPALSGEIALDKATADHFGLHVGDHLGVITAKGKSAATLVGTFRTAGQDNASSSMVTAFVTEDAQQLMLAPNMFNEIYLAAAPGVTQQDLVSRVQASGVLPKNLTVITGARLAADHESTVKKSLAFLSTMLLIFAGISLFVGAFIIFNTFTMLVAQRTRELALLRAIGASRGQVRVSVQVEAAVVGFVGATVGLVCGVALASLLRLAMGAFGVLLPPGGTVFRPRTAIAAYLVGVLVTSSAAVVPAYKAATVPPIAALRDTYTISEQSLRARTLGGIAGVILGAVAVVGGLAQHGSGGTGLIGGGAAVIFLSITALSPVLVRPIIAVLGAPLPRLFGVTGRLGQQNATRNPRRTAATASALMIGLALVSAFAIFGQSIKTSVERTVAGSLGADYYIGPVSANATFSDEVRLSLVGLPGIGSVVGIQGGTVTIGGRSESVLAADPAAVTDIFSLRAVSGSLSVGSGQIAIDATKATALGLRVGTPVPVHFPGHGDVALTLVGTFTGSNLVQFLVTPQEWVTNSDKDLDALVMVKQKPNADSSAVAAEIHKVTDPLPNLVVNDRAGFIAEQEKTVNELIGLVYVLLALAVVIALFGIINTLALSVIERTREIGLLRAVGLRRGQMWVVIVLESVVIALFGATLGIAVGSFLGWALVSAMKSQGLTNFAYPTVTIMGVLVLGGFLGVAAAVLPALRAARMNVLRAIATA